MKDQFKRKCHLTLKQQICGLHLASLPPSCSSCFAWEHEFRNGLMVLAVPFEKPGFIFTKSRNQNEENVFGSTLSFFPRKYSSSSLNFSLLDSIYDRKIISGIFQKVLTAFVFVLMVALKSATQSQLAKNKQNKV